MIAVKQKLLDEEIVESEIMNKCLDYNIHKSFKLEIIMIGKIVDYKIEKNQENYCDEDFLLDTQRF